MIYVVGDVYNQEVFETTDINEARAKLAEIKARVMEHEDYRFTVAKEIVNGNDTTWVNADLDNDPEDSNYHVFNTLTGQHELVVSLSLAKARRLEIKEQFVTEMGLNGEPQEKPAQPVVVGAQDL